MRIAQVSPLWEQVPPPAYGAGLFQEMVEN